MRKNIKAWLIITLIIVFLVVLTIIVQPFAFISTSRVTSKSEIKCNEMLAELSSRELPEGQRYDCDEKCWWRSQWGGEWIGECRVIYDDRMTKELCALPGYDKSSKGIKGAYPLYDVYYFNEDETKWELKEGCDYNEVCQQVTSRTAMCVKEEESCTPELIKECMGVDLIARDSCTGKYVILKKNDPNCGYVEPISNEIDDNIIVNETFSGGECVTDENCDVGLVCIAGFCLEPDMTSIGGGSDTTNSCLNPETPLKFCECYPDHSFCKENDMNIKVFFAKYKLLIILSIIILLLLIIVVFIPSSKKGKSSGVKKK